jgi:hypothetical protein
MAINIPIITSLEDTGIKNAKAAFNDFKTAVGQAEGGMNKFKAGSKAALDGVKANAATFAIAAGASIATFAVKAIGEFQNLALAAGKFSDATGLTVEEASKFIEVAGDIGIEAGTVETAIGRMNKTLGTSPKLFDELNIEIGRTETGATDVNKTFLNVVERLKGIKDPAEKAKVASQLLGKGWQQMAELIEMGADDLKASLDSVSDQKIIDENEVRRARDFRDSMDQLNDKIGDVTLAVGEFLLPVVQNLLDKAVALSEVELPGWMQSLATAAEVTAKSIVMGPVDAIKSMNAETEEIIKQDGPFTQMLSNATIKFDDLTEAAEDTANKVSAVDQAFKDLKDELELESAVASAKEQLSELKKTAIEAFNGAEGAVADYEQGVIDAQLRVLALAETIALTDSQKNQIRILVDTEQLDRAISLIEVIGAGGYTPELNAMRFRGARANGGPVMGGSSYLVGERGPELFTPSSSGNITPNGAIGGNTITVNVNGGDPDAVVRAIQKYARQNGAIPLQTTTGARF